MTAPGEKPATAAWKERWRIELHCEDCRAEFVVEREGVHVTLEQTQTNTRLVLIAVPEVCPLCRNLKVVRTRDRVFEGTGICCFLCRKEVCECGVEPPRSA